jgi:hypothetical protein
MDLFRFTIIDGDGGVSFVAHAEALPALLKALAREPNSLEELLDFAAPYNYVLREHVLNGLAVFDERNVPGSYDAIHQALDLVPPHEQPVFRIVDDETREASLRPVKAGGVIVNLLAKRIVQIQNTYQEIGRKGRGRIFDGERVTESVYYYRLPREWQLVP